ncbi:MAG: lipoyl(octanoyl) transferase LipB [Candidatus Omnitrophota bacterium]
MEITVFDLGVIHFQAAWNFQKEIFRRVREEELASALIICRHYPVITQSRAAKKTDILAADELLKQKGITILEVDRGGSTTYHGPGQLTAYPILNLRFFHKDIHWYLRLLENTAIDCLNNFGVFPRQISGLSGVWYGQKKIASIGIAVRNWITCHGISINIKADDLANFRLIRPCGMDIEMASLETILGRDIEIEDVKIGVIENYKRAFSSREVSLCSK